MSDTAGTQSAAQPEPRRYPGPVNFLVRLVKEKPLGTVGGGIVLIMLIISITAQWIAPFPYAEIHLADRLQPPSAEYLLGTDQLGRDLLSRILYGARLSLYVGLGASAVNVLVAAVVGIPSGYIGGTTDIVVQRFVDALLSFPGLVFLITVMSLVGTGILQVIVVLGVLGGIRGVRVTRSAVISIRQNVYFEAATAIGSGVPHMLVRHVLPNIMPILIVIFSMSVASNILQEAALSFLGFGIPPPAPSWGGMISHEGRKFMYEATWLAIWPGVALSISVYGISFWGDAVRDLLDPRLRGGAGRFTRARNKMVKK